MSILARRNPIDALAALVLAHNVARRLAPLLLTVGTCTLIAGTVTVSGQPNIQANSSIGGDILTPGGTLGANYKWVPTATGGGFTVTAVSTAGATVTTDTSVLQWQAVTPCYHADQTSVTSGDNRGLANAAVLVTAANATDLPSTLTLCANIDVVLRAHLGDALGSTDMKGGAHKAADSTDVPANAVPVDLTTAEAYLNDVKSRLNTHIASTSYHYNADGTNTISTANATDLASSEALANAIKATLNAHMAIAPAGASINLVD